VSRIYLQIFVRIYELSNKGEIQLPLELEFIKKIQEGESIEKTEISAQDILHIDDHFVYSLLNKWSRDGNDKILSDLSNRILNRRLLKIREDIPDSYNSLLEILLIMINMTEILIIRNNNTMNISFFRFHI
jgi:hypothetical protein